VVSGEAVIQMASFTWNGSRGKRVLVVGVLEGEIVLHCGCSLG